MGIDGSPPALRARSLSKTFGGRRALVEAGLDLLPGQVQGIIGPNGAGKSTLVGILAGTVRADRGEIDFDGTPIVRASVKRRARLGLARSFQTPHVFETLTLRKHITLLAADGGWGWEMAQALHLGGQLDRRVGTFSHGMRRLAEICHLAASRPRVLLLDEPAAGLTGYEMGALADALRWLRGHTAVAVVEHNMAFLLPLADSITVLEAGRVIAHGTSEDITGDAEVRRAYLGVNYAA